MEDVRPWGMDMKTFLILMHLSQFAGFIVPGAGLVLPIVMWATSKELDEEIDRHGRVILNWIVSSIIYYVACIILVFVIIGVLGLIALLICNLIFVILGAVKASEGVLWEYPLSIKFFSRKST